MALESNLLIGWYILAGPRVQMRLPLLSSLLSHVIEHRPVQSDCRTHHVILIWSRIIFVAHYLIFLPIFLSDYKYNISIILGTLQWTYIWWSEWSRFWLVSESIKAAHSTTSSLMTFTSLRSNRPVSFDSIWISFEQLLVIQPTLMGNPLVITWFRVWKNSENININLGWSMQICNLFWLVKIEPCQILIQSFFNSGIVEIKFPKNIRHSIFRTSEIINTSFKSRMRIYAFECALYRSGLLSRSFK